MQDELDIAWILPDGRAGGSLPDGSIVRVDRGLPGDRVRFADAKREGRALEARTVEVVTPSPHRRAAPCPWNADCGGCDTAELDHPARRAAIGHIAARAFGLPTIPVVPSPRETGHRARIKLTIDGNRLGYRAARSHRLVEVGNCLVARPELQAALAALRAANLDLSGLASVELRSDGTRAVYAFTSEGKTLGAAVVAGLATLGDVALDGRRIAGDPRLVLTVGGVKLRASPAAFFQVNLEANALLVAHVQALLARVKPERVLDLYAGIGNFSLPIAAAGTPVVAVESEGQAIDDLRAVAKEARLPVEAHTMRVERFDPTRSAFDAVILDPPRTGAPGVIKSLLRMRPRALVYVSCNPPTGARDVKEATSAGYRLTDAQCFDLFPDTRHVETVVLLERPR